MEHRRIGRTDVSLSVVGFGTAQLQMQPRRVAIAALRRAFERGIDWVHTAPDYGGVEGLIGQAVRESGRPISVVTQSPAMRERLEPYFERDWRHFARDGRLDLYGINCIDDIERTGEDVWGPHGMIAFLAEQKRRGRLRAIFCSTHAPAAHVVRLIASGAFDAVMVAYNPLGFHQLSYHAAPQARAFENLADTRREVFPAAERHGVSVIVMKPLAGGMLSKSLAFPPAYWPRAAVRLDAADLLRYSLELPAVACVLAGTASEAEAESNARAGTRGPLAPEVRTAIDRAAEQLRLELCSRCGECEDTCSHALRIASLARDAYIWSYGSETFMADDRENWFSLHPDEQLRCVACAERTCRCPQGIDVPRMLADLHAATTTLQREGKRPARGDASVPQPGPHPVAVVSRDIPANAHAGARVTARFLVENRGDSMWTAFSHVPDAARCTGIAVTLDNAIVARESLRQNICAGMRSPIAVEFPACAGRGTHAISFALLPLAADDVDDRATVFHRGTLTIR